MGRKRKDDSTIANKDKTSDVETKATEETISSPTENSNSMDNVNVENKLQPNSNGSPPKKKKSGVTTEAVRRSGRINSRLPSQGNELKPVMEHVNLVAPNENQEEMHYQQVKEPVLSQKDMKKEALKAKQVRTLPVVSENEMENEVPKAKQVSTLPVVREKGMGEEAPQTQQVSTLPIVNQTDLEEKVDYLVQAVDEFKSMSFRQVARRPNESPPSDLSYKSLYIDSQKKIEALMEEKHQLAKELEFARGKVEAYENMKASMGAPVYLVPNIGKATEDIVGLSPQTVQKSAPPTAAAPHPVAEDHKATPKQKKKNYKTKKAKI